MNALDAQIFELEGRAQELRGELTQIEKDLQALYRARELVCGPTDTKAAVRISSKGRASIPTLVEQLLKEFGAMHADDITEKLRLRGYNISKQSITSALSRYIDRGERFERTGRNKFALRQAGP
jgi:ribosomal protein L9